MDTNTKDSANEQSGLFFKKSVILFNKRFWFGCILSIVVIAIAIVVNVTKLSDFWSGLANGVFIFAGGAIGLLFAPAPRPLNHDQTASSSVQGLLDMGTNVERARVIISEATSNVNTGIRTIQLSTAQDILLQHDVLLARSVEDWNIVAPGVVDRVVFRRNEGHRRFKQLIKDEGTKNGEQ